MRLVGAGVFVGLSIGGAVAQGYTENWRDLIGPSQAEEVISWRKVVCTANDDVIVFGKAQNGTPPPAHGPAADLTDTIFIVKYDSAGNLIWQTRDFEGLADDVEPIDLQVDGAGNVYVSFHTSPGTGFVSSFAGSTGAQRWSHSLQIDSNDPRAIKLSVRSAGNSTFVYAGANRVTSFDLFKFNSANGSATGLVNIPDHKLDEIQTDLNGNVFLGQLGNELAVIRKLNQSFSQVWAQTFASARKAQIAFDGTTNRLLAGLANLGLPNNVVSMNGTNGTIVHSLSLPRESEAVFNMRPGLFGSWYMVNPDEGEHILGLTATLKPFVKSLIPKQASRIVTDTSGQTHFANVGDLPLTFAVRRRAAAGLFETAIGQGAIALDVATDSQGRVVAVGQTAAAEGVVIQLSQSFLANTDQIVRDFQGTLNVEAPGVLANDSNWIGGNVEIVTPPAEGTVTLNQDGSFQYVPGANYDGVDQFQYSVTKAGLARTATCVVRQLVVTQLAMDNPTVVGPGDLRGTITVNNPNFTFDEFPTLSLSSTKAQVTSQPRLRPGTTGTAFTIRAEAVFVDTPVTVSATASGQTRTTTFTILRGGFRDVVSVNGAPLIEGQNSIAQVRLTGPAPQTQTFSLSYTGMTGPASATIPAGANQASISVAVAAGTVGTSPKIRVFTVVGPKEFTFTVQAKPVLQDIETVDNVVYAGTKFRMRVLLDGRAGTSSITVNLVDNSPAVITPSSVTIVPNSNAGIFEVTAPLSVANTNVAFQAALDGATEVRTVLIRNNLLENFTVNPNVVAIKGKVNATIFLNWVAPSRGQVVVLEAKGIGQVTMPASITIPAGQTNISFQIQGKKAGALTVSAIIGEKKISRALTVTP